MPDAHSPISTVSVSAYGNYVFRWTVVNGPCTVTSDISITFIQQSAANAGLGGNVCDLDYTFNALPITSGIGTWTKIGGQGNTVFTPDINQPGATVTVDQFGTYDFAWTVVNSTCSSSDIIRVGFHGPPEVNAGRDTAMCRGESVQLQSTGSGTVLWTPAEHVSNPTIINPVVTPDVTTTFTLSLTDQFGCRNSDEIIVGVRNNTTANAGPDQNIVYVTSSTLDAEPPAEFETGVWSVFSGTGILTDPTDPKTAVENLSPGENSFIWTVSNGFCPLSRDTSNIYVNDFVIPTLITPNMDGRNDYFVISGLFTFGKTELIIFDRRGSKVYSNPDYDNSWDGVNYNNNPLPDDTYFYSLKAANGISFKGYIVIKR
jgi:gliding motility-associated-like protein